MSVRSKIFDKNYYYNICLGSKEFKESKGEKLNKVVKKMIDGLDLRSDMSVLEIGCGRGDATVYMAKKVSSIIGIDYSKDAIKIANEIKNNASLKVRKRIKFYKMNADKLFFKENKFDYIVFIDTLDHLNTQELNRTMKEIKRVLRPNGKVYIKTCSNKLSLNFTYKYYTYPLNILLTTLDKIMKKRSYDSLPKNPRTKEARIQHVNEPNYFYLMKLFEKHNFKGKINSQIGFLIENKGIRSKLYNFFISLYPLSKFFPLNILFASSFNAELINRKNL